MRNNSWPKALQHLKTIDLKKEEQEVELVCPHARIIGLHSEIAILITEYYPERGRAILKKFRTIHILRKLVETENKKPQTSATMFLPSTTRGSSSHF